MAAPPISTAPAPRVPAWKRLGLKLKNAQDNPPEATPPEKTHTPANIPSIHAEREAFFKPQKRNLESQQAEIPVKRAKVELAKPVSQSKSKPFPGSAPKTRTAGQQVWNDEERSSLPAPTGVFKAPGQVAKRIVFGDDEEEDISHPLPSVPSPPKQIRPGSIRKSVSFTPETKQEDTFSAQSLIQAWEAEEDRAEAVTRVSTEPPASVSEVSKEPKAKKEKKKKRVKASPAARVEESKSDEDIKPTSEEVPSYVKYLEQFSQDKTNWKFNKNRQADLFRNLFDVDRIPSRYNPALIQYVSSTQGQARRRIAEQAEEVLKAIWVRENDNSDLMSLDTPEARRAAYYEALQSSIDRYEQSGAGRTEYGDQQLKEILREHEKGKRAEEMLSKALQGELWPEEASTSAAAITGSTTNVSATTPSTSTSTTIPRATRVIETQRIEGGQVTTREIHLTNNNDNNNNNNNNNKQEPKRKRNRKSRTDVSSSSDSSSSSSSDSSSDSSDDSSDDSTDDNSEDDSRSSSDASAAPPSSKKKRRTTPSKTKVVTPTLPPLFDSDVLDKKFGKAERHS